MDIISSIIKFLSDYASSVGLIILVVILAIVVVGLIKTQGYFVERFPKEEDEQRRYFSNKVKADEAQARVNSLNKSIEDLRQCFINEAKTLSTQSAAQETLNKINAELAVKTEDLSSVRDEYLKAMDGKIEAEHEVTLLKKDVDSLKEEKRQSEEDARKAAENVQKTKDELEKLKSELGSINRDELDSLEEKISEKRSELSDKRALLEEIKDEIQRKKSESDKINSLNDEIQAKSKELESLKEQCKQKDKDRELIEVTLVRQREDKEFLENRLNSLKQEEDSLKRSVAKMKESLDGTSDSIEAYSSLLEAPQSLIKHLSQPQKKFEEENIELNNFYAWLKDGNGYNFDMRVIKAFHTSLKIQKSNPLTVLAGISGTGKTLLPVKYAEYFGIYNLVIPVQPRWDSHQDLVGFYNYLEKRYMPTELSRSLVQFDKYCKKNKYNSAFDSEMMLVLLDEMNLARTEYYFSEFLSKLEMRRLESEPDHNENAKVKIDDKFGSIWVPYNVLFVGTMNEDESTQTLSDKVLDRANVMRFGKPSSVNVASSFNVGSEIHSHPRMNYEVWKKWYKDKDYLRTSQSELYSDFTKDLDEINESLEKIGKPFGYRVRDSIIDYISNYPVDSGNEVEDYKSAMADQLEQKIFPKLRGLDLASDKVNLCLTTISRKLESYDHEMSEQFNRVSNINNTEMFLWKGMSR